MAQPHWHRITRKLTSSIGEGKAPPSSETCRAGICFCLPFPVGRQLDPTSIPPPPLEDALGYVLGVDDRGGCRQIVRSVLQELMIRSHEQSRTAVRPPCDQVASGSPLEHDSAISSVLDATRFAKPPA